MKKKALLTAAIVLTVLLAVLLSFVLLRQEAPEEPTVPTTEATQPTTQPETRPIPTTEATAAPTTEPVPVTTAATEPTQAPTEAPTEAPPPPPVIDLPTEPPETTSPYVSFPYAIPETPLVIEDVKSYSGIYLEDGSDEPIEDVAAILVRNEGNQCVEYAEIRMNGTEEDLRFVLSGLEAGASAVVMEADRDSAVMQNYWQITADAAVTDFFALSEEALTIEETEDGQLQITNISETDIPCARIFYKFYLADENLYVGGIAYTVKLLDLKAGASATVAPSHYAAGQSKIIMAKLYEADTE